MVEEKKITLEKDISQSGNIKVHAKIIDDLSSGIYSSPASCIKELINNSFDADAKLVTIRIKPIQDIITIIDDGEGMNALEFDENFAWISKSNKRNKGLYSKSNRPLIGKIGIGFIAVNEICDELEIISTKKDESIKFTAKINFKEFREKNIEVDGGIIKGSYELINSDEDKNEHYTIIRLVGLKNTVRDLLNDRQYFSELAKKRNKDFALNYFKDMRDLLEHHYKTKLRTFKEDNAYIQFIIDLASYIPVEYIKEGPVESIKNKIIEEIKEMHTKFNFKVDLDGIFLKKPIFFPKREGVKFDLISFAEKIKINDEMIKFKGYFYAQNTTIFPRELNGVAIRIKNVPVAPRFGFDSSLLSYPTYTNQILRNWISGEVYIEEGLEAAMNIDRKSFRETHPHFLALQNYLHKLLAEEIFAKMTLGLYKWGKEERNKKKKENKNNNQKNILESSKVVFKEIEEDSNTEKLDLIKNTPLSISKQKDNSSVIYVDKKIKERYKKKDWDILENIFLIFESAYSESGGDIKKLKTLFYQKIDEWNSSKK
ncbi:MAG: ATP-binding protein [Candidatus Pacearchaeota archaeon]|jgi:hypothetical protein